jgi:hypothetical protein
MAKCRSLYFQYRNAIFEKYEPIIEDYLEEKVGKRTSITRVTRQTKIDRAVGNLATKYAKEVDDPMYHKMKKFRDKFFKYRKKIRDKYGPRVRSRAISGAGISDMVKKHKEHRQKKSGGKK